MLDFPLNILLIDDDEVDRTAVRRVFKAMGMAAQVHEASDGASGQKLLENPPDGVVFDVALLDYRLPDADGLAVLRSVRGAGIKTPIIMLTGQGDEQLAVDMMKAGANDYLTKTKISLHHLTQTVRNAVRVYRSETAAERLRSEAEQQKSQLLQRERAARQAAEAAQRRLEFLANASAALNRSLDYRKTLGALVDLCVPELADWCAVDLSPSTRGVAFTPDEAAMRPGVAAAAASAPASDPAPQAFERVAMAFSDQKRADVSQQLRDKFPALDSEFFGVAKVVRTGVPEIHHAVTDEDLQIISTNEEHLALLRQLDPRSIMCVPLMARGHCLGAITFYACESRRLFGPVELSLAEDLAWRCATAVDNALLYQQMQNTSRAKEQFSALLDLLLGSAPVGMAFHDPQMRFVRVNDAMAKMNGIGPEEHIGKTPDQLLPNLPQNAFAALRQALDSGQPRIGIEVHGRTPASADQRDWIVSYYPVHGRDGQLLGAGATVVDITDQKRVQRELREAKEQSEAANRAKDRFLAVLSHELRTPLTPVLTSVQALETEEKLPAAVRSSIEMIHRNVELEARLIDDLLDLTRISKGKLQLNLETADVHALLNHVIEIVRSDLNSRRQHLTVDLKAAHHHVHADSARLQQILWNLLKNAVKFTGERGQITVCSYDAAPRTDGGAPRMVLEVKDNGIGIEPSALTRIFDAFEQANDEAARQFGGLGLGLAITRALVEAHHGHLSAASEGKGRGAIFTLTLPIISAPAPQPQPPSVRPAQPTGQKARILLVDDHQDTSKAMKRLLERLGYDVKTAHNCADALAAAGKNDFDLLISDIGLPDASGLELVRQIREIQPLQAVALSGFGMEEDVRKSRAAGFAEHLTKPINFQRLESVIQQLMNET